MLTSKTLYLSLKWKLLLVSSLLLAAINAGFVAMSYLYLERQHANLERESLLAQQRLVAALISQADDQARRFANLIADLSNLKPAVRAADAARVSAALDPFWSNMQFELGVDELYVLDAGGKILHRRGRAVGHDLPAQASVAGESPLNFLHCGHGFCAQYTVVPLLADGERVGALVAGRSLADVILAYRRISGNDLGLLVPAAAGTASASGPRWLAHWGQRVVALSGLEHNLKVLRVAPKKSQVVAGGVQVYKTSDYHSLARFPAGGTPAAANWLVVKESSAAVAAIHASTRTTLLAGFLGWLISEALLVALIWGPMARLKRTAASIPLLGQGGFGRLRESLHRKHYRLTRDEVDLLDDTALAVANRLESLQGEVNRQTETLANLVSRLSTERDFVKGLLDTAQVAIITQGPDGTIRMSNRYAQELTGYGPAALQGKPFIEYLLAPNRQEPTRIALARFRMSTRTHARTDTQVRCRNGELREVIWVHSRLAKNGADGTLLSVGLDLTERRQAEKQAAYLAQFDSLTGLYNRTRFQDELAALISAMKGVGKPGALLLFDVDGFKSVNDTCGHAAGDLLLKAVGEKLSYLVPAPGFVGRLGGDEFAVVLPDTDAQTALKLSRGVLSELSDIELPLGSRMVKVSATIGIALFPEHGETPRDLLASADLAMHQAQIKGRGSCHLYSPAEQLMERVQKRVYWVEKIEQALTEDRFELHFQPIAALTSDRIGHYEALVRMRLPDASLVAPGQFIAVAESTGQIRLIDRAVLAKAVQKLAELQGQGEDVCLSVNLSGRSFEDPSIREHVKDLLERYGVAGDRLIFEITETAAVADIEAAAKIMHALKGLGCMFSLDDFGAGFSSFQYLKRLPVDYVKIDGSFIQNLSQNPDDQVFVRLLAEAARGFGKQTVAEFVEDAATLQLLRQYGVDYAQGYFIGRPEPHLCPNPAAK